MANFLLLIDPDPDRGSAFIRAAEPKLPPLDGLAGGLLDAGDCRVAWAAHASAPVDAAGDSTGLSIIWGDALKRGTGERLAAKELRASADAPLDVRDGFHAAAVCESSRGVTITTDPLGLFPVYYWTAGNVLLAGSSPELFRHHPLFERKLDPAGLAGILLTNGLVGGRTLLRGVRRLAPGAAMRWRPGNEPREIECFEWPETGRYHDLPYSAHVELIDDALGKAAARHATGASRVGLLLSGGRDSRMLGGYLSRAGVPLTALTLGLPADFDRRCARGVAEALGLEHHCTDVDYGEYARCAEASVRWEHLAGGFNNVTDWSAYSKFRDTAPRFAMGALCDAIIGGSNVDPAYSKEEGRLSFDRLLESVTRRGFSVETLKRLLRKDVFGDLAEVTAAECRETYEGYSDSESQRAFRFGLEHLERFHVGSMAWACSFSGWPVLPFCDTELLKSVCGLPAASLSGRRIQDAILCSRFKELAALPLDRNSLETAPLLPGPEHLLRMHARTFMARWGLSSTDKKPDPARERRYYYRIWDIGNPGWASIRQDAERCRDRAGDLFDRSVLEELLPPPDRPIRTDGRLYDSSGAKLLLGFLLWAEKNL